MGERYRRQYGLTPRQRDILTGIDEGDSVAAIADRLGVSHQRVSELARYLVHRGLAFHDGYGYQPTGAGTELLEKGR